MSKNKTLNGEYTYKELCEILNLPRKSGTSRITQLKKLHEKHLFTEEKTSKTNTLYKFSDSELQKETFNLKILSGYIKYLTYRVLTEEQDETLNISVYDIKKMLGLCNDNFYLALYDSKNVLLLDGTTHLPKMAMQLDFFLTRQIKTALNYLMNKCGVLIYDDSFRYKPYNGEWILMTDDMRSDYLGIIKREKYRSKIKYLTDLSDAEQIIFFSKCRSYLADLYHIDIEDIKQVFHITRIKEDSDLICTEKIEEYNKKCLDLHRKSSVKLIDEYIDTSRTLDSYSIRDKRVAKNMFGENPRRNFQEEIDNIKKR